MGDVHFLEIYTWSDHLTGAKTMTGQWLVDCSPGGQLLPSSGPLLNPKSRAGTLNGLGVSLDLCPSPQSGHGEVLFLFFTFVGFNWLFKERQVARPGLPWGAQAPTITVKTEASFLGPLALAESVVEGLEGQCQPKPRSMESEGCQD